MDHQSTTFPLFPSLPAELRLMVFEQALLPLIETRIVEVSISHDDPRYPSGFDTATDLHRLSFSVENGIFLQETQNFVVSAETLAQVCREGRAAVEAFRERYGRPQYYKRGVLADLLFRLSQVPRLSPISRACQAGDLMIGDALFSLSRDLSVPLRPRGPHADILFWPRFRILEREGIPSWSIAGLELALATRWLVPMGILIGDLFRMEVPWDPQPWLPPLASASWRIKDALLGRKHDIIALVPSSDSPSPLRYSDLVIVSAAASRETIVPGLKTEDRDFLVEKFEHCKESFRLFEEQRLSEIDGPPAYPGHAREFPDLYFAYVDPRKRSKPRLIKEQVKVRSSQPLYKTSRWRRLLGLIA